MGGKRGEKRTFKKGDSSKLEASDAVVINEDKEKKVEKVEVKTPETTQKTTEKKSTVEIKKPAGEKKFNDDEIKKKIDSKETIEKPVETTKVVKTTDESGGAGKFTTDDLTNEKTFVFQRPAPPEESRLNTKVSEATKNEGSTYGKNQNGNNNQHQNTNQNNNNANNSNNNNAGGNNNDDDFTIDGGNNKNAGNNNAGGNNNDDDWDNVIDNVPPPDPGQDYFDKHDKTKDGGDGGHKEPVNPLREGIKMPQEFSTWTAEKKAEWIVNIRDTIVTALLCRAAQISPIYMKNQGIKYEVPKHIMTEILKDIETDNAAIEDAVRLKKIYKKILQQLWTEVLKQYNTISDKVSPLSALIFTEVGFFIEQASKLSELKQERMERMGNYKDMFEEFYNIKHQPKAKHESNASSNKNQNPNNQNPNHQQ